MQPNTLLDAILDEAGISHAGLAAHVNQAGRARGLALRYEHTAVARWLKGQRPRGQVPDLICEVLAGRLHRPVTLDDIGLGVPGEPSAPHGTSLSGFVERATALWRSDEQQRPHILGAPAVTGTPAVMPVWEWENPPEDVDVSRGGRHHVKMSDIEMLRAARAHYEQMYRKAGGIATRTRIVGFLNSETAPLLRGSYTDATGRQLHRATGGLVAIAGICAYDSDAHGLAQRYFHQALRLAKASGDRGLGAYVIALLVNQALFMREYRQAVAFAEAALRAAGKHITPALASDLYAMQAKAYAHLGDSGSALSCIRRAETAADRIRRGHEPDETGYVQPGTTRPPPWTIPRTTGGGCTGWPCSAPSNCARAMPRRRWSPPCRWPSRHAGWSPSGCATDCARYASTWCAAARPAPPRRPNSSTVRCAYRCRPTVGRSVSAAILPLTRRKVAEPCSGRNRANKLCMKTAGSASTSRMWSCRTAGTSTTS
jgi:tetratricopeptide (TPR) repeat protein